MIYHSYTPSRPLAAFVERFWQCSDTPSHRRERILPSGTIEVVINLWEDEIRIYRPSVSDRCERLSGAVVSGPYNGCFLIDPSQHASIVGIHFKPGGAYPFLSERLNVLADAHVDLEALWGRTANELRERLCAATSANQRFSLLERALVSRLRHSRQHHGAVTIAIETFERTLGRATVREVACRVGLSQRQFIQVFATEVGLTPKLFCRVLRFQHARELIQNLPSPNWTHVAVDCGYFDQSHLIRDFKAFSGLRPMDHVRQWTNRLLPNHIQQSN